MTYKHWMHKQRDPWVLFLRCYQHLTGEVSLPPRKNPSQGSIVQSYAKFWQRMSFSLHHAMKLAGLKHSREVSQEVGCESEDLNRHDSAGGRERVSSMDRLDLNVSQRPACQKPGCQSGTIRWSNPGEAEPSGRYLEHRRAFKWIVWPQFLPLCLLLLSQKVSNFTLPHDSTRAHHGTGPK